MRKDAFQSRETRFAQLATKGGMLRFEKLAQKHTAASTTSQRAAVKSLQTSGFLTAKEELSPKYKVG